MEVTVWLLTASLAVSPDPVSAGVTLARSLVAPGEPVLLGLYLQNRGKRPITLDAFDDPRCYLAAYAILRLDPPAPTRDVPQCQGKPTPLQPGERLTAEVDLQNLVQLGNDHVITLRWKLPPAFELTPPDEGLPALRVRKPLRTDVVEKGQELALPAGTFAFVAHNHKSIAKGSSSPLMVSYRWTPRGGAPTETTLGLYPDVGGGQFTVGPYTFEIRAYAYDVSMTLRIFE